MTKSEIQQDEARPATAADDRQLHHGSLTDVRRTDLRSVVKFAATAAVIAMLADAVFAHAIFWQNDPYWSYWVTDTFLMTTVFGLGTAWFGAGVGRGAILTVVQTFILTTYYWSLSPIGLPGHAEWLDLERTWVTGLPVHFSVYYLGYLTSLWLWRRHGRLTGRPAGSVASDGIRALTIAVGIVVLLGVLQTLVLGDFPGVTWFIVRLVVLVPFLLLWWSIAGTGRAAAIAGGLVAATILAAYGHYLGPIGLPNPDLRILAGDSPPAEVHWLSFQEEFLVMLPITVLIVMAAFLIASRWHGHRWGPIASSLTTRLVAALSVVALVVLGIVVSGHTSPAAETATVSSQGQAMVENGEFYVGSLVPTEAELTLVAEPNSTRSTPHPPHDRVQLDATITGADGVRYEVRASQAMIAEPLARWGTSGGVDSELWNHGRSGIGSSLLPASHSEVIVFALSEVWADGELVASGVPVLSRTVADGGLELIVGDPEALVPELPDGHLRVVWDQRDGGAEDAPGTARYVFGAALIAALIALAVTSVRAQRRDDL